jgi:hypothetical protein
MIQGRFVDESLQSSQEPINKSGYSSNWLKAKKPRFLGFS